MMKRYLTLFATILLILMMLFSTACGTSGNTGGGDAENGEAGKGEIVYLSMATGSSGGMYYIIGSGFAKILNDNLDNIDINPQSVVGSAAATKQVNAREFDIALASLDAVQNGVLGIEEFDEKMENIRTCMAIMNLGTAFITMENTGINEIADFKGKSIGANTAMEQFRIEGLLKAFGIDKNDVKFKILSYAEQATALKDGNLDVAFISSYPQSGSVLDLFTTAAGAKFVSIEGPGADIYSAEFPQWEIIEMPAGTYPQQDKPVNISTLKGLLIAHKDIPDDVIYDIVKVGTTHPEEMAELHPAGADFNLEQSKTYYEQGLFVAPIHPGAQKYFEEQGMTFN